MQQHAVAKAADDGGLSSVLAAVCHNDAAAVSIVQHGHSGSAVVWQAEEALRSTQLHDSVPVKIKVPVQEPIKLPPWGSRAAARPPVQQSAGEAVCHCHAPCCSISARCCKLHPRAVLECVITICTCTSTTSSWQHIGLYYAVVRKQRGVDDSEAGRARAEMMRLTRLRAQLELVVTRLQKDKAAFEAYKVHMVAVPAPADWNLNGFRSERVSGTP